MKSNVLAVVAYKELGVTSSPVQLTAKPNAPPGGHAQADYKSLKAGVIFSKLSVLNDTYCESNFLQIDNKVF